LLLFGRAEVWRFDFGVDMGITSSLSGVRRRHHRSPTSAIEPAGQDPEARLSPGIECSTAPIAQKSQFFLDNVIAGLSQSWAFEQPMRSLPGQFGLHRLKDFALDHWTLVRTRYDDGGFSGGSTDRPGPWGF
jgi:hypothetical protein